MIRIESTGARIVLAGPAIHTGRHEYTPHEAATFLRMLRERGRFHRMQMALSLALSRPYNPLEP